MGHETRWIIVDRPWLFAVPFNGNAWQPIWGCRLSLRREPALEPRVGFSANECKTKFTSSGGSLAMSTSVTTVRPLGDRVLVRPATDREEKIGSIIVPDTAKEKPQE